MHSDTVWPEFILHDPVGERYWEALYTEFAEYQLALTDADEVIGTGNSIPPCLEGEPEEEGWDWALEKGFAEK